LEAGREDCWAQALLTQGLSYPEHSASFDHHLIDAAAHQLSDLPLHEGPATDLYGTFMGLGWKLEQVPPLFSA
jgi:hypothetical protein